MLRRCYRFLTRDLWAVHFTRKIGRLNAVFLEESFDNDRVFGDADEVGLEAYPTGERDSHRKRFDSFESWDSASSSCSPRDDGLMDDEMELDENGLIFMSFEASHEFREMRATREVQHYGRVRVFKGPLGVVFYIGPHWYAIIVMVGVIVVIGFGFAWMLTPWLEVSENQRKVQGLVGTILTKLNVMSVTSTEKLRAVIDTMPSSVSNYVASDTGQTDKKFIDRLPPDWEAAEKKLILD
ncbi:hypothetical protein FOZ62_000222, partial [Perkinsus olseni]